MNKGQIFSIDLLFAIVLIIFAIGVLIGSAEINNYNQKQQIIKNNLITKTIIGAEVLTNSSEWNCDLNNTHPAYSINTDLFNLNNFTLNEIKTKANLIDYNIRISLNDEILYEDIEENKDAIIHELDILSCTNQTTFNELKECIDKNENCPNELINKKIFKLEVAK
ncbi:MAG: hypothetical protein WC122_02230 [archaeon]